MEAVLPLSLLRLVSASLPVGAFAYSRGLETAVAQGWVHDADSARDWILGALEHSFAALDGALFLRMMAALAAGRAGAFLDADAMLAAARSSRELQQEDRRMAEALLTLRRGMGAADTARPVTFPGAFALAAHDLDAEAQAGLLALMWGMADSQVAAAIRLGCMGQTDGQRILAAAPETLVRAAAVAAALSEDEIGNVAIGQAMASALHETQGTRLFRS